jgi:hypothetical protein
MNTQKSNRRSESSERWGRRAGNQGCQPALAERLKYLKIGVKKYVGM